MSTEYPLTKIDHETKTPAQAIRQKCLACNDWDPDEVSACPEHECPLWSYRLMPETTEASPPAKHPGGRPLLFSNCMDLEFAGMVFFEECWDEVKGEWRRPFTMSGLAVALGISRRTLTDYAHRDEFLPAIKRLRAIVEKHGHEALYSGKGRAAGPIFDLKVNHGWREEQTVVHDHRVSVNAPMNVGGLRQLVESEEAENQDGNEP